MSIEAWEEAGSSNICDRASDRVSVILGTHHPSYIDKVSEKKLRETLPILLPKKIIKRA